MNGSKPKLRIGLLLNSLVAPAWMCRMIEIINRSDYASIVLVVVTPTQRRYTVRRLLNYANQGLYQIYQRLESFVFRPSPNAFAKVDLSQRLAPGVPVIRAVPIQSRYSHRFSAADTARIRDHHIDVLIRGGSKILRGDILKVAKFGVWSYHHGDNTRYRGTPPGFWEVFEQNPVTGAILQVLTEDLDNGTVLARTYSATDILSANRNCNSLYWKTLSLIPRKLKELYDHGDERFFRDVRAANAHPVFYTHRMYGAPTNVEFIRLFLRHVWKLTRLAASLSVFSKQWMLLFGVHSQISTSFRKFKYMIPPRDRFWADPCVVARDGKYYIFIEEFVYRKKKGIIAVIEMDASGNYSPPVPVLEQPYHMSYPYVFQYEGDYYMIPETKANATIEIHKCIGFPRRWEKCKVLMANVHAVDSTVFHHNGKWWMFTNLVENEGASPHDELFLFHADSPLAEQWHPHPLNPIVSDARRARPAGGIIAHNGKLYRPSQKVFPRYGWGFNLNEILVLNETGYRETLVQDIHPEWDSRMVGMHSLSYQDGLTCCDGLRKRWRWL